jgi:iron-sulfur cluster insertion protein
VPISAKEAWHFFLPVLCAWRRQKPSFLQGFGAKSPQNTIGKNHSSGVVGHYLLGCTSCRSVLLNCNEGDAMSAVAENIETTMPEPIVFTDSAAAKVADLIAEEGNPSLKLRVFVQGGGCSGFQYGFTFDEITNEDDTTMTKNGVSLLIDAMSYQYLLGAEIDYKEDLQGAQFVIKNPNATTTCGCGSSFSV